MQWIWLLFRHLRGCTSTTHLLLLTATTEEDESATTASAKHDDDGNDATASWRVQASTICRGHHVVHFFCRRGWRRATFVNIVARTCRVGDANVIAKYIICGGTAVLLFTNKTAARYWPITEREPTRIIIIVACRSVDGYVISTGGAAATAAQRAV